MPTPFGKKLAGTAEKQYDTYHWQDENDPDLSKQIKNYWIELGFSFPGIGTAWSAVFVSWCVKKAGATSAEFKFAKAHSKFVYEAIRNAINNTGVFRAYDLNAYAPDVGDIIHNNRDGYKFDYNYAKTHDSYESHSAIVIERGIDSQGGYVLTVGGNESDSIRKKLIRLTASGLIKQRESNPYISIIQTLK
jgi:hypothetical protein